MAPYTDDEVSGVASGNTESLMTTAQADLRFWARLLDILIWVTLLTFVVAALWPGLFQGDGLFSDRSARGTLPLVTWFFLPFAMVLDAIAFSVFGNTLGKVLAGIKVRTIRGERVAFLTYLKRNFGVYWFGLGTGFPLVSLFTLNRCYKRAKKGELMRWDRTEGTRCYSSSSNVWRTWFVGLLYIFLLVTISLSNTGTSRYTSSAVNSVNPGGSPAQLTSSATPRAASDGSSAGDRERIYAALDVNVPNWENINKDPGFLRWLNQRDPVTGDTWSQALAIAFNNNDETRVVKIFKTYLDHTRRIDSKAPADPSTSAPSTTVAATLTTDEMPRQNTVLAKSRNPQAPVDRSARATEQKCARAIEYLEKAKADYEQRQRLVPQIAGSTGASINEMYDPAVEGAQMRAYQACE